MSGRQVIEREWKAPLDLVWELWTTPEGMASWYGPRGFEVDVQTMEVQVGGAFVYTMRAVSDAMIASMEKSGRPSEWTVSATYTDVRPKTNLAWDSPWGPDKLMTSATFTASADTVKLVLVIDATKPEMTTGAAMGWRATLDKLEERLAAQV